ncbi:MAG: DUF4089 domain-containing protein [Elainellaceae cyanobacterium]
MADSAFRPAFDPDAYVDQISLLLDLPIAPEYRPGVIANLTTLAQVAEQVMAFPLPPDLEAAPTFDPLPDDH